MSAAKIDAALKAAATRRPTGRRQPKPRSASAPAPPHRPAGRAARGLKRLFKRAGLAGKSR